MGNKLWWLRLWKTKGYELVTKLGLFLLTVGVGLALLLTSGWEPPVFVSLLAVFVLAVGVAGENRK